MAKPKTNKQPKAPRGIEKYEPTTNPVTKTCQYDRVPMSAPTKCVWSIIEGESGRAYACAGYHVVNHMYYIITKKKWVSGSEQYLWA
jgi:hypothetical protein